MKVTGTLPFLILALLVYLASTQAASIGFVSIEQLETYVVTLQGQPGTLAASKSQQTFQNEMGAKGIYYVPEALLNTLVNAYVVKFSSSSVSRVKSISVVKSVTRDSGSAWDSGDDSNSKSATTALAHDLPTHGDYHDSSYE